MADIRSRLLPLPIAALLIAAAAAQDGDIDPRISGLIADVSEERLGATVRMLQDFGTRHTLSSADSATRGIGAARQWIHDQLAAASPRLQVSFDTYQVPSQGARMTRDVELRNVVAVLPGRSPRRFYVSAHYDSVARVVDPGDTAAPAGPGPPGRFDWSRGDNPAPGANDDGSGTALTMELAGIFGRSGLDFDPTLVFILFAGEEEGLVGSRLHAQRASREGIRIDGVLNNDIVGNPLGGNGIADAESVRVFSEGPEDSASRQLARYLARHAARYIPSHRVVLVARHDRFGRGGDHTSFNEHGFAAVRITESNENYYRQHSVYDLADGVSPPYLARNARVNTAVLASLALAPPAPEVSDDRGPMIGRGPSGYDAELRWRSSPGATGYRVVWRTAWQPDWQHDLAVADVTSIVLRDVSIDDHVFGVAALGPGGHESLVTAYVNPPRTPVQIRVSLQ